MAGPGTMAALLAATSGLMSMASRGEQDVLPAGLHEHLDDVVCEMADALGVEAGRWALAQHYAVRQVSTIGADDGSVIWALTGSAGTALTDNRQQLTNGAPSQTLVVCSAAGSGRNAIVKNGILVVHIGVQAVTSDGGNAPLVALNITGLRANVIKKPLSPGQNIIDLNKLFEGGECILSGSESFAFVVYGLGAADTVDIIIEGEYEGWKGIETTRAVRGAFARASRGMVKMGRASRGIINRNTTSAAKKMTGKVKALLEGRSLGGAGSSVRGSVAGLLNR